MIWKNYTVFALRKIRKRHEGCTNTNIKLLKQFYYKEKILLFNLRTYALFFVCNNVFGTSLIPPRFFDTFLDNNVRALSRLGDAKAGGNNEYIKILSGEGDFFGGATRSYRSIKFIRTIPALASHKFNR